MVDRDGPEANPAHRQNDSRSIARTIRRRREPEPLKNALAGYWSRRIDQEHRLVYQVFDAKIRILGCRFHYCCALLLLSQHFERLLPQYAETGEPS